MNPIDMKWEHEGETLGKPSGICSRTFAKGPPSNLGDAIPAKLGKHPRRTKVTMNGSAAWRSPRLLGSLQRKSNFVDRLVGKLDCCVSFGIRAMPHTPLNLSFRPGDLTSQIVEHTWPLSAATSHSYAAGSSITVFPLRTFIQEVLRRARTSYSTLRLALYYMIKIKPKLLHDLNQGQSRGQSRMWARQCGRRMFLTALILASKYLQDDSYSNRTWSKISGFEISEINNNELLFLDAICWRLHVCEATFRRWTNLVLKLTFSASDLPAVDLNISSTSY
jgi:hypothetical protein